MSENTPTPTNETTSTSSGEILKNLLAGLTVSFVAISLGAAFGILSERGAFVGILSAGVIALITALFGGTRIQCSGPTAPMTAVIVGVVVVAGADLQDKFPGVVPDHFVNMVLIVTGVLLLVAAALKLGRFITLVPKVVISGFMNGIAVLIWLDQVKKLFGLGGKTAIDGELMTNVAVAGITLLAIFVFPKLLKPYPKLGFLPGTLIAIIIITVGVHAMGLSIEFVTLETSVGSLSDLTDLVRAQVPTSWSLGLVLFAAPFAFQLAMLCYLDTLLTSLVVDQKVKEMLGKEDPTKPNKELAAQGIANAVVALFGGIPGAQATIRSVLILNEKATLRLAGVMVGVFVLIEMLIFQDYISLIPQAVFVGVLLKVGYDVFDWEPLAVWIKKQMHRKPLEDVTSTYGIVELAHVDLAFILGVTVVTIIIDLNTAVISFTILFYVIRKFSPIPDLPPALRTAGTHED